MTVFRLLARLTALALTLWAQAALAQLEGAYLGLGAAAGWRLEIAAQGDAYAVALTGPDGERRAFPADRLGDGAEGVATLASGEALVRIAPQAVGVRVVAIPFDGVRTLDAGRTETLAFRREDVALPQQPKRFLPAPTGPVRAFDARAFVESYPFWEPQGALWAYEALEPRHSTVIRLFALVQADLLWKLCQSPQRGAGLAEALRGQGVVCADVAGAIAATQAGGAFDRFKADVAKERALLVGTLDCGDKYVSHGPDCPKAAQETARRAVSMETAATVLRRYR